MLVWVKETDMPSKLNVVYMYSYLEIKNMNGAPLGKSNHIIINIDYIMKEKVPCIKSRPKPMRNYKDGNHEELNNHLL